MLTVSLIALSAICCICEGKTRNHGVNLDGEDLQHYLTGYFEIADYDVIQISPSGESSFGWNATDASYRKPNMRFLAFGEDFHLDLFENIWLLPPDFRVKHITGSELKEESYNGKRCHFYGRSINHNDSVAAISTCSGTRGVISFGGEDIFIEPLKETHKIKFRKVILGTTAVPHIVYKRRLKAEFNKFCGNNDDDGNKEKREADYSTDGLDFEYYVGPKFIEISVFADHYFVEKHSPDTADYALSLLNMASRRFVDPSLGFPVRLILVSLTLFHDHYDEPFTIHNDIHLTLGSFQTLLLDSAIPDDNHPQHWDHAILFSGYDYTGIVIGVGTVVPPMCFPSTLNPSSNILKDTGLATGLVLVHEIGHSLGLRHDDENGCGIDYIMSSYLNGMQSLFRWSTCSRKKLTEIWRGKPGCLDEIPMAGESPISFSINNTSRALPSLDEQCEEWARTSQVFPTHTKNCVHQTTCTALSCSSSEYTFDCELVHIPPTEGSTCGDQHVCINGECVLNTKTVSWQGSSDGGFSKWKTSPCSRSCGGGIKVTTRVCSNPRQRYDGAFCDGQHYHYELCNEQPCTLEKTLITERNEACSRISYDLSFRISSVDVDIPSCLTRCYDRTEYDWFYREPFYFQDGMKCWDGTWEDDFSEKRCVAGKCVQFNCYGDEGNQGLYDVCRICGGNGDSCYLQRDVIINDGIQNQEIILPAQATSILILNHDCDSSVGRRALEFYPGYPIYEKSGHLFVTGYEFVNNSLCTVNLTATGPLRDAIYLSFDDKAVTYKDDFTVEYYLPKTDATYIWRPGPLGLCSADCGNGQRRRIVRCVRILNGRESFVLDYLCSSATKPASIIPCSIPCWTFTFSQCIYDASNNASTSLRSAECRVGNKVVDLSECNQATRPVNMLVPCERNGLYNYEWHTGSWSQCYKCKRERRVTCVLVPQWLVVPDDMCNTTETPKDSEPCTPDSSCDSSTTEVISTTETPAAFYPTSSDNGLFNLTATTEGTTETANPDTSNPCSSDEGCVSSALFTTNKEHYHWSTGPWSDCLDCELTREVKCLVFKTGLLVQDEKCNPYERPFATKVCESDSCRGWILGKWSECSATCGAGSQRRNVYCSSAAGSRCSGTKPLEVKDCYNPVQCQQQQKGSASSGTPIGMVLMIVAIAITSLILLGVFFRFKRKKPIPMTRLRYHNTAEDLEQLSIVSASVDFNRLMTNSSNVSNGFAALSNDSRVIHQIQANDLPKCLQSEHLLQGETLEDEYLRLQHWQEPDLVVTLSSESESSQEGAPSNQSDPSSHSGYRTPCYIEDCKGKLAYIATTEKRPSTDESFWRLIFRERVSIIVTIGDRNESVTYPYLQSQDGHTGVYGEFSCTCIRKLERPGYLLKEFNIAKRSDIHQITICHYCLWPESGIPKEPESLIGFIKKVNSLQKGTSAPLLIHCNKDFGRSGAFIIICSLMKFLKTEKNVNVEEFATNLRAKCRDLLPNQEQYMFIYETLAEAFLFPLNDLYPHTLLSTDLNDGKQQIRLKQQFKALSQQRHFGNKVNALGGCKPDNTAKTRSSDVVSLNPSRMVTDSNITENVRSDTKVTLADSFWMEDGIIIMQSPLSHTIEDFWNVIYSYGCAAVVSLNGHDENVPQYWIDDKTVTYGKMAVECTSLLKANGEVLTTRKMIVRRENSTSAVNVDHYDVPGWSTSESKVSGLLDVTGKIQTLLKAKKRVALVSSDGSSRCGVIASVSTELGRVREDGVVDLFQTVLKLRRRRSDIIKTQEEYNFCQTVLQAALQTWRDNF